MSEPRSSAAGPATLHVRLRRGEHGYPPFESEELSGVLVGDHVYRLLTTPAFASGLAVGDLVRVRHFAETTGLWVDELVTASQHSTVRVIGLGGADSAELVRIALRHGGAISKTPITGLMAIDVSPTVDFSALYEELRAGRTAGSWDVNVGVLSGLHAAQMKGRGLD